MNHSTEAFPFQVTEHFASGGQEVHEVATKTGLFDLLQFLHEEDSTWTIRHNGKIVKCTITEL